ncbi:MAG: cation transporter [Gammaproteobacteria bacterium]
MRQVISIILAAGFLSLGQVIVSPSYGSEEAQQETVTLTVEGMTCPVCPITVRTALERVPGVKNAEVDLDTQTATIVFDPVAVDVETLTAATTNAGFPSSVRTN